jgi:hypothetical protein
MIFKSKLFLMKEITLEQAMKAQRGSRVVATLFLTSTLDVGGW